MVRMLVGSVLVVVPLVPWLQVLCVGVWDVLVVSRPLWALMVWMVPAPVGHAVSALVVRSLPAFSTDLTHGRRHRMNFVFHETLPPVENQYLVGHGPPGGRAGL